jgi:hypothetical protein
MAKQARSKVPSAAIMVGGAVGVPVGQIAVQAAQEFGVQVGPATASLAATLLSLAVAYFTRGGRKGESH